MRELKTSQHRQVSSTPSAPIQGDLADEDEREKQFHERAALDAERYARYAKAFDQLCAATLGTSSLPSLLQKLIEILVEASRADVGVLRLRDGVVISEAIRSKGMRRHYCLKLLDGDELVGAALMGARDGQELSEDDHGFLRVLGSRAAAAISQVVAREALRSSIAAREGILAVVAHDLKNPVHVI